MNGGFHQRVSIVMPVFNGAAFIGEAIDSVLAQTYEDWELVVVDDGSTDHTPEILEHYGDPRIIRTRQANQGEAAARNTALDLARGEFVSFLDADDLYLPNALADMVRYFDAHPEADALISDGYFCDEQGHRLMRFSEHRPIPHTGNILEPLVLSSSVITATICTMIRRAAAERAGARFDPSLVIGPDYDFFIQLARHARFGYLDRLTSMYRVHQTNITLTSGTDRRRADLVRGRLKVMNADWFQELSLGTRREFFYNLLIGLLGNDPKQQDTILKTPAFRALSAGIQADVLRLVAGNHISERQNTDFALQCLRLSLTLQPDNLKSSMLLRLANQSPSLAIAVLSTLRAAHRTRTRIRSFGQRQPKPVPTALLLAPEKM